MAERRWTLVCDLGCFAATSATSLKTDLYKKKSGRRILMILTVATCL